MIAGAEGDDGFGLSRIGQIHVPVRDLEEAVAFYRDVLGIPFLFQAAPGMAFFRCGEVTLMLGVPEGDESGRGSSILYFAVEDVEAAHRILAGRGAQFISKPHAVHRAEDHELWMAFFRDPSDNTHAIMSRRPID